MKVIVNIGVLRHPLTGVGRYMLNLLQWVNQHPDIEDLVGVTLTGFVQRDRLKSLMQQLDRTPQPKPGLKGRLVSWAARQSLARALQRHWIEQLVYWQRSRYKAYVYWESSGPLLPFQGPVIATVFDLSYLALPECHPATRVRELNLRIPSYLQQANRLVSISRYTKSQLQAHYAVNIPIDVVPPAVAPEYFNISVASKQDVKARLSLPDRYVLAVSTLEPRKNLNRLVQAYGLLPQKLRDQFPLLLVGAQGWMLDRPDAAGVHCLGYLDQADLPAVVAQATLNVYVSLYEGYGMPIAESMAAGTPVLCSNTTSMPEVANNCCFLVDPTQVCDIAQTMQMLLESDTLRTARVAEAKAVASDYTWAASALAMVQALGAVQP